MKSSEVKTKDDVIDKKVESAEKSEKPRLDETLSLVAKRPAKGKAGKKISAITNSFVVQTPLDQINLYMIEFVPDIPEDAVDRRLSAVSHKSIRDKIIANYGPYFFENKHLLCLRKVLGEKQFTNEDMTLTVSVKFLKSINMKDLTSNQIEQHEQVIHWMLNKVIRGSDLTRIGANYFESNEALFSGKGKFDVNVHGCPSIRIWRGYSISCERKLGGIHMNVDTVHRVLHTKSIFERMKELLEQSRGNEKQMRKRIEEMVRDNVVITIHNRRLYRVAGVDWSLGIDDTFEKGGKAVSYRQYFRDAYNEGLSQPFKGMLVHTPRPGRRNKGGAERIVLPPELCHETGLSKKLKSNYTLMRQIAETTRIPAGARHELRKKLVGRLQKTIGLENTVYDTDSAEGSQKGKTAEASSSPAREVVAPAMAPDAEAQIPLILDAKPVRVEARVLPDFKISVNDQSGQVRRVDPYSELQAAWNNAKFINKSIFKLRKWVVLGEDRRTMDVCLRQISNVAQNASLLNTYISPNPERIVVRKSNSHVNSKNWADAINEAARKHKPQLILCVLPDDRSGNPTAVYNLVKTLCCTELGILTQCITSRNVMNQKRAGSVFKGCIKQMLTKMGNTPWRAHFKVPDGSIDLTTPTMICGMDVNHDMRRNCSTVSFVASYTSDYTKYHTFVYHQTFGREVMIEGGALMGEALKEFHKCNKTLPENILVYRDGVSASQLSVIVMHEVRSYKERFAKIKVEGKRYAPKLAVVVTQKNVSARFIDSQMRSLRPGTVVDSEVVSSKFWDFYLIPCAATNRGSTASPSRFIVAYDDMGLTQDDISILTNQLCNIYFNIAAAVRVPAPIQYAHKIAHMFGTAIENKKPCRELIGKPFFL